MNANHSFNKTELWDNLSRAPDEITEIAEKLYAAQNTNQLFNAPQDCDEIENKLSVFNRDLKFYLDPSSKPHRVLLNSYFKEAFNASNPFDYLCIRNRLLEKYGEWCKRAIDQNVEDIKNECIYDVKPYWYNLVDADIRVKSELFGIDKQLAAEKKALVNMLEMLKSIFEPEFEHLKKIGEGLYAQNFQNSLPRSKKSHNEKEKDYNALKTYQFGMGAFNTLSLSDKKLVNSFINEDFSEYARVKVKADSTEIASMERSVAPKLWLVKGAKFTDKYAMPKLAACDEKPKKAIPFDKAFKTGDTNQWVHFFIDDQLFECVWDNPKEYLDLLKSFDGVIGTDFSLYLNMPLELQIWNTYRNRAIAFWLQQNGVNVIPNVQWSHERSYDFCFNGIPMNSVIAISTYGCIQDAAERFYFKKGLNRLVKRLAPKTIVVYSNTPDDIFLPYKKARISIIHIPNWNVTVRGRGRV